MGEAFCWDIHLVETMKHGYSTGFGYGTKQIWRHGKIQFRFGVIQLCKLYMFIIISLLVGKNMKPKQVKRVVKLPLTSIKHMSMSKFIPNKENGNKTNTKHPTFLPEVLNKKWKFLLISSHINKSLQLATSIASSPHLPFPFVIELFSTSYNPARHNH